MNDFLIKIKRLEMDSEEEKSDARDKIEKS